MKVVLLALLAGAGMESSSLGVVNTSIVFQVSLDGINWSSSVEAFNGQPTVSVYARATTCGSHRVR